MVDDLRSGDFLNEIGKWHKPWFYKYVDDLCFDQKSGALKGRIHIQPPFCVTIFMIYF